MIDIKNLSKSFDNQLVLKNINLKIENGEKVAIIGASGSGKSTLLRMINLLEEPTLGEIFYNEKLITNIDPYLHDDLIQQSNIYKKINKTANDSNFTILKIKNEKLLKSYEGVSYHKALKKLYKSNHQPIDETRMKIGMVFQHFNLFNNLNIIDNLILAPVENKIMSKDDAIKKAKELLERINLSDKELNYPSVLSGGEKQRIAIIRALMMNPEVILFDEPTSALDPEMVKEVLNLIEDLSKTGITMIIVTHEMAFAKRIASRIVYINDGIIEEDNTPEKIFNNPKSIKLKEFLNKTI